MAWRPAHSPPASEPRAQPPAYVIPRALLKLRIGLRWTATARSKLRRRPDPSAGRVAEQDRNADLPRPQGATIRQAGVELEVGRQPQGRVIEPDPGGLHTGDGAGVEASGGVDAAVQHRMAVDSVLASKGRRLAVDVA